MNKPKLDVTQLRKRDPLAWTMLLNSVPDLEEVVVTAVSAKPITDTFSNKKQKSVRYTLTLANHSDPISFIGKRTNRAEAIFYRDFAHELPTLTPRCLFSRLNYKEGWVILEDVPSDHKPHNWTAVNIETLAISLAKQHINFWKREEQFEAFPHFIGRHQKTYSWEELREKESIYFEEGPAADLSEHAIKSAGHLAPTLLRAANGLSVIRALDGWPGILGESHLTAAADLLDDPLPMLETLSSLPQTLLHGNPHNYCWHLTLFEDHRLLNWHKVSSGPGILDLIKYVEQADLIHRQTKGAQVYARRQLSITQETMIDSYLLTMKDRLGSQFDARLIRQAIPAARCLYVLTHWFPHFADWFAQMPSKYTWQKINHMPDNQLVGTFFQPLIGFRPYLADVFRRFIQAYYML